MFHDIVEQVMSYLEKKLIFLRKPLEPALKVRSGWPTNTISCFVPHVSKAIVAAYGDRVLKMPGTAEEWWNVARKFLEKWNFTNTIGAIDGKHVRIKNPPCSGSWSFNYKKYYLMVMLSVANGDYSFLYMEVGDVGSESDRGMFAQSELVDMLNNNKANLPPQEPLPVDPRQTPVPYFMLADDDFTLKPYMMKLYPIRKLTHDERIYNCRVSKAQRVVENASVIMANM
ncbi:uncharacterized protein [Palaemon carinicauda]|uniref:uncharacterized protein n=1 Tax=Palaemon carinicauda TaxID=392227 RepID=UPI0035B67849